jgi:precorrin-6A synthase
VITVLAIGIGSGSPAHLTAEAAAALNRVDVFLVADKRAETSDLAAIRTELAKAMPFFAALGETQLQANGVRFELATV